MARSSQTISVQVIQTVADATDRDASELPPLYGDIDPDALDALVEGMTEGEVSFTYAGHDVTVTSSGFVSCEGHPSDAGVDDRPEFAGVQSS